MANRKQVKKHDIKIIAVMEKPKSDESKDKLVIISYELTKLLDKMNGLLIEFEKPLAVLRCITNQNNFPNSI